MAWQIQIRKETKFAVNYKEELLLLLLLAEEIKEKDRKIKYILVRKGNANNWQMDFEIDQRDGEDGKKWFGEVYKRLEVFCFCMLNTTMDC